jgi:hypothetical protein
MKISSQLHQNPQNTVQTMVFDTLVEGKTILVGLVQGDYSTNLTDSPIGQACHDQLLAEHVLKAPSSVFHALEIRSADSVRRRIDTCFAAVNELDTVEIWCLNVAIYDEVAAYIGFGA